MSVVTNVLSQKPGSGSVQAKKPGFDFAQPASFLPNQRAVTNVLSQKPGFTDPLISTI